jgi:hypothetical protein
LSKPSIHKITIPNPPNSNLLLQLLRLIHPMREPTPYISLFPLPLSRSITDCSLKINAIYKKKIK